MGSNGARKLRCSFDKKLDHTASEHHRRLPRQQYRSSTSHLFASLQVFCARCSTLSKAGSSKGIWCLMLWCCGAVVLWCPVHDLSFLSPARRSPDPVRLRQWQPHQLVHRSPEWCDENRHTGHGPYGGAMGEAAERPKKGLTNSPWTTVRRRRDRMRSKATSLRRGEL